MGANLVNFIEDEQGARVAGDVARNHHEGLDCSTVMGT
jgi:hypothetical protein